MNIDIAIKVKVAQEIAAVKPIIFQPYSYIAYIDIRWRRGGQSLFAIAGKHRKNTAVHFFLAKSQRINIGILLSEVICYDAIHQLHLLVRHDRQVISMLYDNVVRSQKIQLTAMFVFKEEKLAAFDLKRIPKEEFPHIIQDLQNQMEISAKNLEFEKAAGIRDELQALKEAIANTKKKLKI